MPYLAKIAIYPVKSLDAVHMPQGAFTSGGALLHDREYALMDAEGEFVDGKRYAAIHRLRSMFDVANNCLSLRIEGDEHTRQFHLMEERSALESWLSGYFDKSVTLARNTTIGFPSDTNAPGPTIISTATLQTIAAWFPGLTVEDMRQRFRANLELDGVPPFWEDQLFSNSGEPKPFQIGTVQFLGINPCQRCIVPTRDPNTGEATPAFQRTFVAQRRESLPNWTPRDRFNHFYRLSVNTRVPTSETDKVLYLGDEVCVL